MSSPTGDGEAHSATQLAAIFDEVHIARLVLRRPRASDADAMFAIHGDPATHRYSSHDPDPDRATSEATLSSWIQAWDEDGFGYWAVSLQRQDGVIGFGGVRCFPWRDGHILNLYFRFTPSAWGYGYATEMARAAITLARAHLPHLPVFARVRALNLPSIRVAEQSGLLRAPELDDDDYRIFALGWLAH